MECEGSDALSLISLGSLIIWVAGTIWWIVNSRYINSRFTKPVHFILSFALVFKSSERVFSYLSLMFCESENYQYYDLGLSSAYTLYNTFLYTILLLMSKGLSLTRDYLERNEISLIALIMGVIYLGFSAFTINKQDLKPILILMLSILWYSIYSNSKKVILTLMQRYAMMRANNLNRTLQAIKTKISMMKLFTKLTSFLFCSQLACIFTEIILIILGENSDLDYRTTLAVVEDFSLLVSVFGICIVFMPRYRGNFFEMADFETENEMREVTPMYEAVLSGQNQELVYDKPFVLTNPVNPFEEQNMYQSIMIAMPMTQTFRRNSVDDLRVPLLGE